MANYHKIMVLLYACLILGSVGIHATTYQPVPLEQLIESSDAVAIGQIVGSAYRRLPNNEIVTVYFLNISESVGLDHKYLLNSTQFQVTVPGGKWNGVVYHTIGAPTFQSEEKVMLILRRGPFGHIIEGLGLGKYSISQKNGRIIFENSVFPSSSILSMFDRATLDVLLQKKYGHTLEQLNMDRVVRNSAVKDDELLDRSPSSEKIDDDLQHHDYTILYLIIMCVLIGLGKYIQRSFSD